MITLERRCEACGTLLNDGKEEFAVGDLRVHRAFEAATWRGKHVDLTRSQFKLVELLASRPAKVVPIDSFFTLGALNEPAAEFDTLKVQICRARRKFCSIDPDFDEIKTVHGVGYAWGWPPGFLGRVQSGRRRRVED